MRVTGLFEESPFAADLLGRESQHERIAIEPNQRAGWPDALSDLATVPTRPDRAIQHRESRLQLKLLEDFSKHDGNVSRRSQGESRQRKLTNGKSRRTAERKVSLAKPRVTKPRGNVK